MSENIVQLNEEVIKSELKELVRGSVEETLNELLEAEAEKLTQAARYERNEQRQGYRSGHYNRNLTTTSGDVTLKVSFPIYMPSFLMGIKWKSNSDSFIITASCIAFHTANPTIYQITACYTASGLFYPYRKMAWSGHSARRALCFRPIRYMPSFLSH